MLADRPEAILLGVFLSHWAAMEGEYPPKPSQQYNSPFVMFCLIFYSLPKLNNLIQHFLTTATKAMGLCKLSD